MVVEELLVVPAMDTLWITSTRYTPSRLFLYLYLATFNFSNGCKDLLSGIFPRNSKFTKISIA